MQYSDIYLEQLNKSFKNVSNNKKLINKTVLITGATGLIGSALVDVLLAANANYNMNIKVIAASRDTKKVQSRFYYWDNKYETMKYDALSSLEIEDGSDYIIHCASNAHPALFTKEPVETVMTNVIGTNNLLKNAYLHSIRRFLYVSSSEVYGQKENDELYKENDYSFVDILNARACYPSSKRLCETLCASYLKEYNVDCVIVRPGHVYGPTLSATDTRAYAQFIRNILNEENIVMKSPGFQLRSYCYVLDCVSAMLTVLINGKSGEAYNISNKDSVVTIRQLAETCAKYGNKKIVIDMPTNTEKQGYNMMTCSALDATKLEKLGWKGEYNIKDGINSAIDILKISMGKK